MVNSVKSTNIKHRYKTDHCLVALLIDKLYMERGPGMFKMNNSILLDKAYQNNLKEHIKETVRINEGCNANTLWKLIKGTIRNKTIKYSVFKKKKEKETELIDKINSLELKLQNANASDIDEITTKILTKKTRVRYLYRKEIKWLNSKSYTY